MAKLTRVQALAAIRGAGASNDRALFMRLYVENRVSLSVANAEWAAGRRFAAFIEARDARTGEAA